MVIVSEITQEQIDEVLEYEVARKYEGFRELANSSPTASCHFALLKFGTLISCTLRASKDLLCKEIDGTYFHLIDLANSRVALYL